MVQNGLASTEGWNQREHDTGEEATGLFSCDLEWLVSARWAGVAAGWGEKKIGRENSFKQRAALEFLKNILSLLSSSSLPLLPLFSLLPPSLPSLSLSLFLPSHLLFLLSFLFSFFLSVYLSQTDDVC